MTDQIVSNSYLASNPDYRVETETQADSSQRQVVASIDKYYVSDVDESANPKYYGFLDVNGSWYIMRNTSDQEYRYFKGDSDYPTNWTNRASLSYDYYNEIF